MAFDLEAMLFDLGFGEVEICDTMDGAREKMDARRYNAIVFDLNIDGELTTPLIERAASEGIFTVIASGYDRIDLGIDGIEVRRLSKPYTEADVSEVFTGFLPPDP